MNTTLFTSPSRIGHDAAGSRFNTDIFLTSASKPASLPDSSRKGDGLIEALAGSSLYQDYERAFGEATGLPISFQPVSSWHLSHRHRKNESPFCAMMAQQNASCASCLRMNQKLADAAINQPKTMTCPSGLRETAVPVRTGERLIGFLRTGQVFHKRPTAAQFDRAAERFSGDGLDMHGLKNAYLSTRVVASARYDAMVKMLSIFAQQLSAMSNQIVVQNENQEPPMIGRAKEYIRQKQGDKLSLAEVAKVVNTSTYYFCKMFKRATHLTFTNYVSRVRIEKAKNFLLNRNLRVSEIAYETGFQSLTHFNRIFKKIVGRSPTEYRLQLPLSQ